MTTAAFKRLTIPTCRPGAPEELPMFFEGRGYQGASGRVYPIPYTSALSDTLTDTEYNAAILENEYIRMEVLPELGGRIRRAYDKTHGYDFIYYNKVIKPALIGLAGPWISGGIEFNWPQHHRPTTFMPVEAKIENTPDGEHTVWVGETEPLGRMRGMAGITVCDGRSYIKAKVRVFNSTPYEQPFMWWANLSVQINKDYRVVFPQDVEFVTDHDRRAVTEWPVAHGRYGVFDYGEGTDIHRIPAVKVPSSFMVPKGQSCCDFVSGYDGARECGVVTVADHRIAAGKKLFHWGDHEFGHQWCANLADDGSRYIELMTGVFTDNQPDFTWIMPGEEKSFEQYWYPIADIGEIKNATVNAAVNVEYRNGGIFTGVCTTGVYKNCGITVKNGDAVILRDTADISPDKPYTNTFACKDEHAKLSVTVTDAGGSILAACLPPVRGIRAPAVARRPALPPSEIKTGEELYLNGRHLEQYKHFSIKPESYYLEALRRDPGDSRCNTAMGSILLQRGLHNEALIYFDRAIQRLQLRNDNPYETEAYYKKGLALNLLGRADEAYDAFYLSVWSYTWRAAGYYELAKLDAKKGSTAAALEKLGETLALNSRHLPALRLKYALTGDEGIKLQLDSLDPLADIETPKPEYAVDAALEYAGAGLTDKAVKRLQSCGQSYPMIGYYLGYITGDTSFYAAGDAADWHYCFPSRLEDIPVLTAAGTPMAKYYLGCLYYDRFRYDEAVALWEDASRNLTGFAPVFRNLAAAYYEKRHDLYGASVMLERAMELAPDSGRILYELSQVYRGRGSTPCERLNLLDSHRVLTGSRDDLTVEKSILLTLLGRYEEALLTLKQHNFHTCEGGEGGLTRHHSWLMLLTGNERMKTGDIHAAIEAYQNGFIFPTCYGESRNYYAQEGHLNYALGAAYEADGDTENAAKYYSAATSDNAGTNELSYWRILALYKTGRVTEAQTLTSELYANGKKLLETCSGAGAVLVNDADGAGAAKGLLYVAFAELARGNAVRARGCYDELIKIDRYGFGAYILSKQLPAPQPDI